MQTKELHLREGGTLSCITGCHMTVVWPVMLSLHEKNQWRNYAKLIIIIIAVYAYLRMYVFGDENRMRKCSIALTVNIACV
jgi:dipeptide/tripeptide permease